MSFSFYLSFLDRYIHFRLDKELRGFDTEMPAFENDTDNSKLTLFIKRYGLTQHEIIVLLLALVPHISPGLFSDIISEYLPDGGDFPAFGGVKGKNHRGIIPTGETALFILAGNDTEKRVEVAGIFDNDHLFSRKSVLYLEPVTEGEPKMSGKIILDDEYVDLFTSGKISKPRLSSDFPAQLITTEQKWEDLVLRKKTMDEVKEIETWLKFNEKLMGEWDLHRMVKPGYRVLFHGPSGTGKTLTASLLGKYTGRDVFRIDLSLVVSKYIGETEKNLSRLFDKASNKDWILVFDEADSIFGKRTGVRDAHDKYANQETSYLLQRMEAHAGLVILTSNMKSNIDPAFTRRFNSIIEFENPDVDERVKLWENYFPDNVKKDERILLKDIAAKYELTGANIVNILHYVGLQTMRKGSDTVSHEDLMRGIKKEFRKEGKMIRSQ